MTILTRCLLALLVIGCKDKPKEVPPAAPASKPADPQPTTTKPAEPPAAAAPTIALAAGETFEPAADLTRTGSNPNPFTWQATPTDAVALGVAFKGEEARAVAAVGSETIELGKVEFNAAYSGAYSITTSPDGKAAIVIASHGGSGDPGFVSAWRVAWGPAAKKIVVAEKGDWSGDDDKVPDWAKPAP